MSLAKSILERQDYPIVSVCDQNGHIGNPELMPKLSDSQLVSIMRKMVFTRTWDQRAISLARQARMGLWATVGGQEASMIGSEAALRKDDFILGSYRDIPQIVWHGLPLYQSILYSRGHQKGFCIPEDVQALMPQIIIGAQIIQAAGIALGMKKRKSDNIVMSYIGEGGTSQGDFYEGLNFAGVFQVPMITMVQNNQYAISVPFHKQTAADTIAQKAVAAGITGVRVDGMDVLAVYKVVEQAAERARRGQGPTLIEALTYRYGPHTMAGDDPSRYRTKEEVEHWREKDPITRFRKYLGRKGLWSDRDEELMIEEAKQAITDALKQADATEKMTVAGLIDSMFEKTPPHLEEQKLRYITRGGK
ncbi:pyruvate dehydrogenase (acetyl-transferring) E1 component subunit alpha [Paenibacillus montanisoli]|uniref:Pyruvate dehydrogenase E1 component subunit alpha n=1 Tax=Paenibacillus montanisoli TaxID=2081970 RepID=A0A328U984_9BACL|nr:pyruvate dehydrogenase (acetyl-transferring) E1 component subunit alpha [Paenibacillus montanisoli]RAP77901.1 pyruvate dehydrogenase (acetyl-transferring) E1 component subunit alpha [Paenibacillus montanisoli]